MNFAGLKIIFTAYALEVTKERLFPESKHRSKRVHKKLLKRFGGEFRKVPCMWRKGDTVYAHPTYEAQLRTATFNESVRDIIPTPERNKMERG